MQYQSHLPIDIVCIIERQRNKTDYGPGKAFELNVDTCIPVWCCAVYFVAAIFLTVSKLYQTSLKACLFVVNKYFAVKYRVSNQ